MVYMVYIVYIDMSRLLRQVKLVTIGGRQMTTWVDDRPDLRRGSVIELDKMKGTKWLIEELYSTKIAEELLDMNRNWDNNNYDKHKGLKVK